jgi:hypothetical protein
MDDAREIKYTSLRCANGNPKVTIKHHAVRAHEGIGIYRYAFVKPLVDGSWR